jgi:hypothetical protein
MRIKTLSFEIDEVTYATLKKELSGKAPLFRGKLSSRLPRLINQWVADDAGYPRRPGASSDRESAPGAPAWMVGGPAAEKPAPYPGGGRLPESATPRMPRLVNQWLPDARRPAASAGAVAGRRRHDRIACRMLIEYQIASRTYIDFITNVSRSGAYLETRSGLTLGSSVILMMPLLRGPKAIRIRGGVVRMDDTGVGIAFHELLEK